MFEKEAEEAGNEKIKENHQFARCARKSYKDGFKEGAEFGYNKACEDYKNPQLTKAKELLRKFLGAKSIEETCIAESEAEQFLNSEVEK